MRTNRKIVLAGFICVFLVGIASATVFVKKTVATYCGACEDLPGVPGVLQRVGFVPRGNCHPIPHASSDTSQNSAQANDGAQRKQPPPPKHFRCGPSACEVRGKAGRCMPRVDRDRDHLFCACEPIKISH